MSQQQILWDKLLFRRLIKNIYFGELLQTNKPFVLLGQVRC